MPTAPRTFALDFNRKTFYANSTTETGYTFNSFKAGDTERFKVYLVEAGSSPGTLTELATTGLTLKLALGTLGAPSSTVYTSVTLTADSGGRWFEGNLPLNVSGVTDLFASSAADRAATIEFELNDSGAQSMDTSVTIRQQLISTTLTDTAAPDVAIGRQEADGKFVKASNTDSSLPFQMIVNDEDGSGRLYRLYVRDGALRLDPVGT